MAPGKLGVDRKADAMHATVPKLIQQFRGLLGDLSGYLPARLSEPEIDRDFVVSKAIVTLGYDAEKRCLQAEYFSGHLYRIDDVSPEIYKTLRSTEVFDQVFQQQVCADCQMTRIGCLQPIYR